MGEGKENGEEVNNLQTSRGNTRKGEEANSLLVWVSKKETRHPLRDHPSPPPCHHYFQKMIEA